MLNNHFLLRERYTGINVYNIPRIPKAILKLAFDW